MKPFLPLLAALVACGSTFAAAGPIRVLYLGKENTPASQRCHIVMQEFGRDAIWFDYTSDAAAVTPEWLAKFDAILLDSAREAFPSLAGVDAGRVILAETATDQRDWSKPDFLKSLRERLLAAAGETRRKE